MRLLLVCDAYLPECRSVAIQMHDLAGEMAASGIDVLVVTLDEDSTEPWQHSVDDGIEILRVATGPTKSAGLTRVGLLRRAFSELSFSRRLWRAFTQAGLDARHYDGIVWYSPSIFLARFVAKVKQRAGCPSYLILRDIFPRWAVEAGVMGRGTSYRILRLFEQYQYRVADVIGVQSEGDRAYFCTEGFRRLGRVEVLHNWTRSVPARTHVPTAETTLSRTLVFGGTMGVAQDMDNILRLAERLGASSDVGVALVGGGSEVARLQEACRTRRLTNVKFVGEKSPAAYLEYITGCLAGLTSLDRRLTTHNIPGKVISYLAAGLPVIASVNPGNDLKGIIEDARAGFVCWNGDDEAFFAAAMQIVQSPSLRAEYSANAVVLCEKVFSASAQARQIASALRETPTSASRRDR